MSTIHTEKATRHFRRELDNDGNGFWVEVPVVAAAERTARLPDPGPIIVPNLEKLPYVLTEDILKRVLKYPTPLTPVPKEDADKFRESAALVARHAALEQELNDLRTQRPTRAVSRKCEQVLQEQDSIDMFEAQQSLDMAYTFVEQPLFQVSTIIRDLALLSFAKVNQFTIRPELEENPAFHFWYEGHLQQMRFKLHSDIILDVARRLHVVLHWHFVPIFRDFMVEHRADADRPWWLKISLVGQLESQSELSAYLLLLKGIPARVVEITWSPGIRALMKTPPDPAPREIRWPALQAMFEETEDVMESGGVPAHRKGIIFEPFPL